MKCHIIMHFILIFTVCKKMHLGDQYTKGLLRFFFFFFLFVCQSLFSKCFQKQIQEYHTSVKQLGSRSFCQV